MARYFDFSEDVSRCPRAQRGLLIFPKYTQIFIWLGKKVRNIFRAFFVLRNDLGGGFRKRREEGRGAFPCIQRMFLSIMNGRRKTVVGQYRGLCFFARSRRKGGRFLRPCPDKKRGHELLHGLESTLWMMLSWRACRQREPQRAFQQELREPWQRERQVLGCPPDGRQEWWIPALCGSWTRNCSSRT